MIKINSEKWFCQFETSVSCFGMDEFLMAQLRIMLQKENYFFEYLPVTLLRAPIYILACLQRKKVRFCTAKSEKMGIKLQKKRIFIDYFSELVIRSLTNPPTLTFFFFFFTCFFLLIFLFLFNLFILQRFFFSLLFKTISK